MLWSFRNRWRLNHLVRFFFYLFLRGCNFVKAIINQWYTLFYLTWIILNCRAFYGTSSHYCWTFLWNNFSWSYFYGIFDNIRWSRSINSLLGYIWRNNCWRGLNYLRLGYYCLRNCHFGFRRRMHKNLRMRTYICYGRLRKVLRRLRCILRLRMR